VRRLAGIVLALTLAAACSGGGDDDDGGSASGSTAASLSTTSTEPLLAEDELEDGRHFGFVTALDPGRLRLVFDRAELLRDGEAAEAAEEDGGVLTEGGSYVRNPEGSMNALRISEDIEVRLLKPLAPPDGAEACCELTEVDFEEWLAGFDTGDERAFFGTSKSHYWLTVEDGVVVAVDEQHVP